MGNNCETDLKKKSSLNKNQKIDNSLKLEDSSTDFRTLNYPEESVFNCSVESFIRYVHNVFRKTNISYPLIRPCA